MAKPLVEKSNNVSDATLQKHIRAISGLKQTLESAQGDYRAALKSAKRDGVNTGQLIAAMGAKKRELEDVQSDLRQYVRYLGLLNMPVVQLDLFHAGGPNGSTAPAPQSDDDEDKGSETAEPFARDDEDGEDARTEHAIWQAGEAGQKAGGLGLAMSANPHDAGMLRDAWEQGWHKGAATLTPRNGIKRASPRRNRTATVAH